jgi:hypothetical protein
MSMEDITHALSNLKLDTEVEKYLHVQELAEQNSSKRDLKSVACTSSKSPYLQRTCSGWSSSDTWYGYDILDRKKTMLLAIQVAEEIKYTFPADAIMDRRDLGDSAYRPGRSKACHAETQLMAYIYDSHYRGLRTLDDPFNIYIYPRSVCYYCHDFARHLFLTTGLQFVFYLNGRREIQSASIACKQFKRAFSVRD